jgi:predicted phosphodiesterase
MKILLTSDTHYGFTPTQTTLILNKFVKSIKKEQPDVILHAGDWGSSKFKHVEGCVKLFRRELPNIPIVGTSGNHDFWTGDKPLFLLPDIVSLVDALFATYKIESYFAAGNVEIFAYNSWYRTNCPPSNDVQWMPALTQKDAEEDNVYDWIPMIGNKSRNIHQYLIEKSYLQCIAVCEKLKQSKAKHKIVVTHFEAMGDYRGDTRWDGMKGSIVEYEMLMEAGATIICYGHSHQLHNYINEQGVKILNCGSDYNKPKFLVLDLE